LGRIVLDTAREQGGRPDSTLWGTSTRVPATEAAFANGIAARCRELDDVHEGSPRIGLGHGGHVNVMVIPGALAVAESLDRPVSGRELIAAIAVGGDLIPRLRMAAGEAGRLGWEGPTLGPFGVAAACGRLYGFDEATMANAMGAAYAHCSGNVLSTSDGTWDVWLNAGTAARAGVGAADLARRGHRGARAVLLGSSGLYPLYFRGEYHERALLDGLGSEFESANVSIKPYSACKCTHNAIYTATELVRRHRIDLADIERIEVRTCEYNMRIAVLDEHGQTKYKPRTVNDAQFSMPFSIATALRKGTVFPDVLTEATLDDPEILALARRVEVRAVPEKEELAKKEGYPPDDVDIHVRGGAVFEGCEPFTKGHPGNPMSFDEVVAKLGKCASLAAQPPSRKRLDAFVDTVERLETANDVRGLARLLS
jgi:2-methylcitrate dehydratase PrpD